MLTYYSELVRNLQKVAILVIGDLMLDRFIWGNVTRISPEAPVPVVEVTKETLMPGGAGNVACNISAFGSQSYLVGNIGSDLFGAFLTKELESQNVDISSVLKSAELPTITKTRVIGNSQQVVRVDRESKKDLAIYEIVKLKDQITEKLEISKICIISDYGKGLISEEILEFTIELCNQKNIPVLVDPKIENFKKYKNITCMTPNFLEARQGMNRMKVRGNAEIEQLGTDILELLNAKSILITRGEEGMSLFEKDKITHIPTVAKEVFDVTGAGDTVISVLAVCLANGLSLIDSANIANFAAGIVVGKIGTATTNQNELLNYLHDLHSN